MQNNGLRGALIDASELAAYGGAARHQAAPAAPLGAAARRNFVARCARKISLPVSKSRHLFRSAVLRKGQLNDTQGTDQPFAVLLFWS